MPLIITLPEVEGFNEETSEFLTLEPKVTLVLEHSLIALSKWEAKWKKPFLLQKSMTLEETLDYIKCMTISQNIPDKVYSPHRFSQEILNKIKDYMEDPMTATVFRRKGDSRPSREVYTAEIIYYYMLSYDIPLKMEKWHLRRLFTLMRVFSEKNQKPKKRSASAIARDQMALNERNRKLLNTKG